MIVLAVLLIILLILLLYIASEFLDFNPLWFMPFPRYRKYLRNLHGNGIKMTFKQFKDIYHINKNRWVCGDKYCTISYAPPHRTGIGIEFNYIDWKRVCAVFRKEKYNKQKEKELSEQKELLELILGSVQGDIDHIRKQSEEEIIKAKEILYSALSAGDIYQSTVKGEQT